MAELARTSPRWSAFLAEFEKYAGRVKDQCVMSAPNDVLVHQGRARESAALLCMFQDCVKEADKILAAKQK
jgi:hypothetical protein